MDALYHHIILSQLALLDGLILLLCVFFRQENLHRHKGAVLGNHFPCPVLIGELHALLVQKESNLGTHCVSCALSHGKLRASVTLPVNRLCSLFIGKGINVHLISHHKCRIEAQSKMPDDLVLVGLVLVLSQEVRSAGECDLIDIFLHFLRRHAKTVVDEFQSLLIRVHHNLHLGLVLVRKTVLSHHIQFF